MSPVTFIHQVHTDGWGKAWDSFKRRRHLPVLGYMLLAFATAYSIGAVRSEGIQRREALARSARTVVLASCHRDNATRAQLVKILVLSEKANLANKSRLANSGTTVKEVKLFYSQAEKALSPTNCKAEALQIKAR